MIAVTGKGGTGKTVIAALLIHFISKKSTRVLAVDADPDSNLPDALGVEVEKTLGDVRELFQEFAYNASVNKEVWLEAKIFETIHEFEGYDLLVMGRPEGEGCYCFANNLLRGILRKMMKHYEYVIVDCEAGLEHFSRKTIDHADYVVIVTDMSKKGLTTAKRIKELAEELDLKFKGIFLVGNRITSEEAAEKIKEFAKREGLILLEILPYDEKLAELDLRGEPVINLPEDSEYMKKVENIANVLVGWSS